MSHFVLQLITCQLERGNLKCKLLRIINRENHQLGKNLMAFFSFLGVIFWVWVAKRVNRSLELVHLNEEDG
jgi:hypothetical protein